MNISSPHHYDIIIIGAGAAGLMAGAIAGARGRRVLILDHAKKPGEKIRISGGGRCNFTNLYSAPKHFLSQNPHFCKSALASYSPADFIALVEKHGIRYHEKTNDEKTGLQLGQLFCDDSSTQIVDMLVSECRAAGVEIWLSTDVELPEKTDDGFSLQTRRGPVSADSLIVACGGPSISKMGASSFGYKIAQSFDISVIDTRPALVPLMFTQGSGEEIKALAGTAARARVSCNGGSFDEAVLFTHRGLSGPAILQISSYWREGDVIDIDLSPSVTIENALTRARHSEGSKTLESFLARHVPARIAAQISQPLGNPRLGDMTADQLSITTEKTNHWQVKPAGSEGNRKAEVTLGGVDTAALSSKTMESKAVTGLYFIGEVVDVTGHLGGHNFQWAWASGYAAGAAC